MKKIICALIFCLIMSKAFAVPYIATITKENLNDFIKRSPWGWWLNATSGLEETAIITNQSGDKISVRIQVDTDVMPASVSCSGNIIPNVDASNPALCLLDNGQTVTWSTARSGLPNSKSTGTFVIQN